MGLLWLALTLFGFAIAQSARRWMKARGPWQGRPLTRNVRNLLLVVAGLFALLGLYVQLINFLGVADAFWSWKPWVILAILLMTNFTLWLLFKQTWQDMKKRSDPDDSFFVQLWKADSIEISRRLLYFLIALSSYAIFVYPQLSPAVGGGMLHQAEIVIRQDRRSLFEDIPEFKIDKAGKMSVAIVAESDQSFIVAPPDKPWWALHRRSIHLKRDLVELVIYTK